MFSSKDSSQDVSMSRSLSRSPSRQKRLEADAYPHMFLIYVLDGSHQGSERPSMFQLAVQRDKSFRSAMLRGKLCNKIYRTVFVSSRAGEESKTAESKMGPRVCFWDETLCISCTLYRDRFSSLFLEKEFMVRVLEKDQNKDVVQEWEGVLDFAAFASKQVRVCIVLNPVHDSAEAFPFFVNLIVRGEQIDSSGAEKLLDKTRVSLGPRVPRVSDAQTRTTSIQKLSNLSPPKEGLRLPRASRNPLEDQQDLSSPHRPPEEQDLLIPGSQTPREHCEYGSIPSAGAGARSGQTSRRGCCGCRVS